MKGKSSCPMCRAPMCFKGILKLKKQWHREKQEETYKNVVTLIFDELMEEYDDIVLQCLEVVQNRFEYMMLKYPKISCEKLDIILRMTWIDIDYLLDNQTIIVYEPRTFEKYLMVSKHRKKMSVYYNEVKNRANSNVHNSRCRDDTDCYVYD